MTEQQYGMYADAIATALWEVTTGNGRDLDRDLWDSHAANCHAAVANTYCDGMTVAEWQDAARARLGA